MKTKLFAILLLIVVIPLFVVGDNGEYDYSEWQPLDPELTALAGLTSAADKLPYFTGSETAALTDFTAFARTILDDADEATFKGTVNLEISTDVQAYDAGLSSLAGLTYASASFVKMTGADTFALRTLQQTSDDLEATIDHDNLLNFNANKHFLQTSIEGVSIGLSTGILKVTTGTGALSSIADHSGLWDDAAVHISADGSSHADVVTNSAKVTESTTATLPLRLTNYDISINVLKDIVTTAPITGGEDNVLPGTDADLTIAIPVATTDADGYLDQDDWDTFNGKADYSFGANNFSGTGTFTTLGKITKEAHADCSATFASDLEILSDATNTTANPFGLSVEHATDMSSGNYFAGGYFANRPAGARSATTYLYGLYGGCQPSLTVGGGTTPNLWIWGLNFAAWNTNDVAGGDVWPDYRIYGAAVEGRLGYTGKTISGNIHPCELYGLRVLARTYGTLNATWLGDGGIGNIYGVKIEMDDNFSVTDGDFHTYGLHITSMSGVGGAGVGWSIYSSAGQPSLISCNTATLGRPVLELLQDATDGAQPCLELDQDDESEGCIDFVASDRGVVATSTGNSAASVRVELNGTKYVIPLFTDQ